MSDHWKSLADLLGSPSLTPSQKPTEPAAEKAPTEVAKEQPQRTEPPKVEVEPPVEPAKPKKRSSWETLASMFNIGSAPQAEVIAPPPVAKPAPAAPATPPSPTQPAEEPFKQSELSLFKPLRERNPALVDMFGEETAKPHESWGKPRRVVDDLGWDDDHSAPEKVENKADEKPIRPVRSLDESAEMDEVELVDGEPVRRSRRRRRRGGRGRGDESQSEVARPEETTAEFRDNNWGKVVSDDVVDEDDDVLQAKESEEDGDSDGERRPRRRRRRRGRGRGAESTEGRVSSTADGDVDSVNRDLLNTDDEDGPAEDLFESTLDGESTDEPGTDPRRRRRRKRNRGGGKRTDEGQSADRDVDHEVDADDADEISGNSGTDDHVDEDGGNRHRNIPTWEDSLSVLIEANIENHRRNDNRGGPRGGGGRNRGGGGGRR